jgi:hypothetical protein
MNKSRIGWAGHLASIVNALNIFADKSERIRTLGRPTRR